MGCKKNENENFYLIKEFKFENFISAQNFVNKVGTIAETEGHHPDIWFGWGMQKLKYLHTLLMALQKVISFLPRRLIGSISA